MTSQQRTYPAGVTCWVDVATADIEATQDFYGGLFGWTFTTVTPPGAPPYAVAQLDGEDVGGVAAATGAARWQTYVAVDDLEATIAAVEESGGRLVDPVEQAGEGGWNATVADPSGIEIRLWKAHRRLGSQALNEPGGWNFSDLWSADTDAAKRFYGSVFGWVFVNLPEDAGGGTMVQVPGYGVHLESTVDPGIRERQAAAPDGFADAIGWLQESDADHEPGWHVTFTVADRDEAARTAESLGARIVRQEDTDWTRTALVVDPQGAQLTLSQFTPGDDW